MKKILGVLAIVLIMGGIYLATTKLTSQSKEVKRVTTPSLDALKTKVFESSSAFAFEYPADHTPYSSIDNSGNLIPADPKDLSNWSVSIASNEELLKCCETPVLEFESSINENMSLNAWLEKERAYHSSEKGNSILSTNYFKVDGKDAVELTGSGSLGSFYKTIAIIEPSMIYVIRQSSQDPLLDKIRLSFKLTQ